MSGQAKASWQKRIAGCFGSADVKFALHASDEEWARDLIKEVKKANISRDEFEKEFVWYVYKNLGVGAGYFEAHLVDQLKTLKRLWP